MFANFSSHWQGKGEDDCRIPAYRELKLNEFQIVYPPFLFSLHLNITNTYRRVDVTLDTLLAARKASRKLHSYILRTSSIPEGKWRLRHYSSLSQTRLRCYRTGKNPTALS